MKRAPLAILAFLAGGCHPSPQSVQSATPPPERTDLSASAYAFARQAALDRLAQASPDGARGWSIPPTSFEAQIRQDFIDHSRYRVIFPGTGPDRQSHAWNVALRRVGDRWELLDIQE